MSSGCAFGPLDGGAAEATPPVAAAPAAAGALGAPSAAGASAPAGDVPCTNIGALKTHCTCRNSDPRRSHCGQQTSLNMAKRML